MLPFSAFVGRSQNPSAKWVLVGLLSSLPSINGNDDDAGDLAQDRFCNGTSIPGSKIFRVPRDATDTCEEVALPNIEAVESRDLSDQVLVFRYRGKVHAVDHKCPHSSFPLSRGTPFDIEDFGVVLSAAISCPKHGWSFDLFTGMGDRGTYRLNVWEVQLRPIKNAVEKPSMSGSTTNENVEQDQEVWVRRKQRIG